MTKEEMARMSQKIDLLCRACWLTVGASITIFGALIVLFEPDIEQFALSQELSKSELMGFFFLFMGVMFVIFIPAKKKDEREG